MDSETLAIASKLIPESYASQAGAALSSRRKLVKSLLSQRRLPQEGWDEASIEYLLQVKAPSGLQFFWGAHLERVPVSADSSL